jgi:death-on-curing protein
VTDPIRWLTPGMVKAFHQESIGRYGGEPGMLDENLLESALARRDNRAGYDRSATIFDPAAEYCAGIVRNHPFVDGNKRAGLLAAIVFLSFNGYRFGADEANIVVMIDALAAGNLDTGALAGWFTGNSVSNPGV